jgi:hypothetical protein
MDSGFWIQGFRRLLTISPGSLPTAARKNKLQAGHSEIPQGGVDFGFWDPADIFRG